MSAKTKVDVVVCTKNCAGTLKPVLERVVRHVPLNRLIIVDGGSEDGTLDVARGFGAEVHFDGGRGLGYARNMALKLVETPIFAFIDGDAFIPENWFSLIKHFRDSKVAVASGFTLFGPENPVLRALYRYQLRRYKHISPSLSNALLRLDHVKSVGGVRVNLPSCEDRDLQERLLSKGLKWVVDRSIISYQPRSLRQHLAHVRWWGRGERAMGRPVTEPAWFLMKSMATAVALASSTHPALLVYYPLLKLCGYLGYLEEAKAEGKWWA